MIASHFFLFWRRCWRRPSLCMGERTNGGIWKLSGAKNFGQISRRSKMLEESGGGGQNVSELAKCTSIGWQEEEVGQVSRGWGVLCASMLCAILCYQACSVLHCDVVHRATLCYNEFQSKQCAVCYMMNHAVLFAARKNKIKCKIWGFEQNQAHFTNDQFSVVWSAVGALSICSL